MKYPNKIVKIPMGSNYDYSFVIFKINKNFPPTTEKSIGF